MNLADDSGEMNNLAVNSAYADTVTAMRQRLCKWTQTTDDTLEVPGHAILAPNAGRQEMDSIRRRQQTR